MTLQISNLCVDYQKFRAVHNVSLTLLPGEILAIIGPSGCGKSTLLETIAGLKSPSAGTIFFDDTDLATVPAYKREMGYMFQSNALFPHMNVEKNISYGLKRQRQKRKDRRNRVQELLSLVQLDGYGKRKTYELSGGEEQRVALARSLAPKPLLLMLDEPLGSLDRLLRQQLTEDLRKVLKELNQTTIHVTHDQDEAFTLADRIAVMDSGEILQVASPQEIWNAPESLFVAEFLGHQNIFSLIVGPDRSLFLESIKLERTSERTLFPNIHPGEYTVVVPTTAITLARDTASTQKNISSPDLIIKAIVKEARFKDGRYELTVLSTALSCRFVVHSQQKYAINDQCILSIDTSAVQTLTP